MGKPLDIIDHHTYVFAGDGCLMEGVSHEACSLAGTLGLGKLICLYDDNGISIDGPVTGWFTDDTAARFEAYGWHVMRAVDGHDADAVSQALREAKANLSQPTLICCKTTIGFGSPNKGGTAGSHGSPLGDDEIALTRAALDWSHAPFVIPEALKNDWDALESGAAAEAGWQQTFAAYTEAFPELAQDLTRRMQGELPAIWPEAMATLRRDAQAPAKYWPAGKPPAKSLLSFRRYYRNSLAALRIYPDRTIPTGLPPRPSRPKTPVGTMFTMACANLV